MKKLQLLFLALLIPYLVWAGGGWPQPKGGYFAKLGQYSIISGYYFTPAGDIVDITTTSYFSTAFYLEYGITEKLTAIANVPFFVRSTLNRLEDPNGTLVQEGDYVNSMGDVDLALKYNFLNANGWVASAAINLGIPLGNPAGGTTELLQTGDGEFNQLLEVYVSKSVGKGYFTLSSGVNNRTSGFSDEFRYGVEAGRKFGPLWATLRMYGVESFNNSTNEFVLSQGIFSNNMEYLSISPEIAYDFNDSWGISAGAGFAAFGRQVLASPSFSVGVYKKRG